MAFPLAIPLVSMIGGLLSSVVGTVVSSAMSKDAMYTQAEINQSGIDTANRFNAPINQVARLREAGLNPNLVYGNGSVAGLTSSGTASTNQGLKNVPFNLGLDDAVNRYMQSKQIDQNVNESKSRQALIGQQIRESMAKEMVYTRDALGKDAALPYIGRLNREKADNLNADTYLKTTQAYNQASQGDLNTLRLQEVEKNIDLLAERTGLTKEQAKTEVKRRLVLESQARLNDSNIKLNKAQIDLIAERILNVKADTKNKDLWHELQELERDSKGALKKALEGHDTLAIIYAAFKEVFGSIGLSAGFH